MGYTIEWLDDPGIVEVVADGLVDHDIRREIFCACQVALNEKECGRLLLNKENATRFFDQHMSGALSIVNMISGLAISQELMIAVLSKSVEQYDAFFQEMARLKDFYVKNFTQRDAAIAWLSGSTPQTTA